MNKKKTKEQAMGFELKIDMTPIIDITFQLLIFFLFNIKFPDFEGKLEANLPKDLGLNISSSTVKTEEIIKIRLIRKEPNTVIYIGSSMIEGEGKYNTLYDLLKEVIQYSNKRIEIDPTADTPYEDMISTLDVCRKVGKNLGKDDSELMIIFAAKKFD